MKQAVDDYVEVIYVNTTTSDNVVRLFQESGKAARDGAIDVLIIDAEGFDLTVLQSFMRIAHLRPPIIVYETLHFTSEQIQSAKDLMQRFGYTVWPAGWNALAVRAGRVESV